MKEVCSDEAALKDKNMRAWITCVFIFSLIWSIGATGDKPSLEKCDTFIRDLLGGKMEDHPIPADVGKIDCPLPPEGTIYDYLFEVCQYCVLCTCTCNEFSVHVHVNVCTVFIVYD